MKKFFKLNIVAGIIVAIIGFSLFSAHDVFFSHVLNWNFQRALRSMVGAHFVILGMVINGIWDFFQNCGTWYHLFLPIHTYLEQSELGDEILSILNSRFLLNMTVLRSVQQVLPSRKEEAGLHYAPTNIPPLEVAQRYLSHATAVYGFEMTAATKIENNRHPKFNPLGRNKAIVAAHIDGIHPDDILHQEMEWGESSDVSRHVLVVDHAQAAIVLSLRGTCSLSTAIMDLAAYSEDFCGGKAHSGMAHMARNTWNRVVPHVNKALLDYPDYSLVLTGHSLGGGIACLMNILIYSANYFPNRPKQCIAFSPPPCFFQDRSAAAVPLDPHPAIANTIAYIHNYDVVSSASTHSVRKIIHAVRETDRYTQGLSWRDQWRLHWRLLTGQVEPSQSIIQSIRRVRDGVPLSGKSGDDVLMVPASCIVWMEKVKLETSLDPQLFVGRKDDDGAPDDNDHDDDEFILVDDNDMGDSYAVTLLDPIKYSTRLLDLDHQMIGGHFLPKYELALASLRRNKKALKKII